MRKILIMISLISGFGFSETKEFNDGKAKITIEDPSIEEEAKPETTPKIVTNKKETVASTYAYICTKGNRKLTYRLSYKEVDGKPPCRVYKFENGKRTVIGESQRTAEVCEKVLDKILHKVADIEGMECDEAP
jgi:hypothetical protein